MYIVRPFPVQTWFKCTHLNPMQWIITLFGAHWLSLGPGSMFVIKNYVFTHFKAKTARTGETLPDFVSVAKLRKICVYL